MYLGRKAAILSITTGLVSLQLAPLASADQVILDDLIVDGSACIGFDCVNGESFGFDTLRLKENNLRIKAQDTSTSASFPSNDWQITFNETSNGGANKFSIDDISGNRTPFTIEAGAPSHSLYVDDGGRIGLGTSTPVVEVHVKDGDTPTLRLEQDGSSGFTPQTWDVAGNETNFFVRDATNGSTLPFRIFPGAPSNALNIEASGDVGVGTTSPATSLHVVRSGALNLRLENTQSTGPVKINLNTTGTSWTINNTNNTDGIFRITTGVNEFELEKTTGNLTILGTLTAGPGSSTFPDYVFDPEYKLMPLSELNEFVSKYRHLPEVVSAEDVSKNGINISEHVVTLLKKVEELTLYTIKQDAMISDLSARFEEIQVSQDRVANSAN